MDCPGGKAVQSPWKKKIEIIGWSKYAKKKANNAPFFGKFTGDNIKKIENLQGLHFFESNATMQLCNLCKLHSLPLGSPPT